MPFDMAIMGKHYEIPTDIAIVETIPRTPSGKADLRAVRRHWLPNAEGNRPFRVNR